MRGGDRTLDDSSAALIKAVDAMDVYGVKATSPSALRSGAIAELWPRLRAAVERPRNRVALRRTMPGRYRCLCRALQPREIEGVARESSPRPARSSVRWVYRAATVPMQSSPGA